MTKEPFVRVLRISHSGVVDAWRQREREIIARGVDLVLASAAEWDEGGAPVRLEPRAGEAVVGVRTVGSHPALFLYDPRPLWRLLSEPWDVLDLHEEPFALATAEILALRALRRQRAPYLVYSAQNLDKRLPLPFRALERAVLRGARGVSVCNVAAGEQLQRRGFPGVPDVIPLGVDVPAPNQHTGAGRRTGSGTVVGYAGRLADHKGVDVLLEALARMPAARLVVAGAGPARERLRERAGRPDLAGRVELVGSLSGDALEAFYRRLDVLAVPSLTTPSWVEQFGRVAVEAMAVGTPVVASDSGALPDVVGGAGLLVPPGDAPALAAALTQVLTDAPLAEDLRARGLERARTCSWATVGQRYVDLYARASRSAVPRDPADLVAAREVEVVVVAYGAAEQLGRTLAPLDGLPCTVVDNSSSAEVRRVCAQRSVRYVDAGANRGFAAGVNIALADRLAPGADVLLLNPDAVIGPRDVDELQRALRADPGLASVGPAQVDSDGRPARVGWPFPTPLRAWGEALGLGRLVSSRSEFAIGSVLLMRAEALSQVGGLDERFFLYAEETDWAYRAARLGWRHEVVDSATAVHVGAGTSSDPDRREAHFHGSQERYARKHFGAAGWQLLRAAAVVGSTGRAVALRGERRSAAVTRLRTYLRGPVSVEAAYREDGPAPTHTASAARPAPSTPGGRP